MPATTNDIQATNRLFEQEVAANRNYAALSDVYTANARVMPPGGETVTGIENIKKFWSGAIEGLGLTSVKLETVNFEALGDGGVEIGKATLEFAPGTAAVVGKYVVIWKHEAGLWKIDVDIWNMNG